MQAANDNHCFTDMTWFLSLRPDQVRALMNFYFLEV